LTQAQIELQTAVGL